MKYLRGSYTYNVTNATYRVRIDPRAQKEEEEGIAPTEPGWTVEVVWDAQALASLEHVGLAVDRTRELAESLGEVFEVRLRRVDLAADVAGWKVGVHDLHNLVKRPQAVARPRDLTRCACGYERRAHDKHGVGGCAATGCEAFELEERGMFFMKKIVQRCGCGCAPEEHTRRGCKACGACPGFALERVERVVPEITGIAVAEGGPIMARFYNKRVQLESQPEEKRRAEESRWRERGWDGAEAVTRVEFQLRGEAIAEFGLRNPEECVNPKTVRVDYAHGKVAWPKGYAGCPLQVFGRLETRLDDVWRYCLSWVRIVERDATRLSRCTPAPQWRVLAPLSFRGDEVAAFRRRSRAHFMQERRAKAARVHVRKAASVEQTLGCIWSILGVRDALRKHHEGPVLQIRDSTLTKLLRFELENLALASAEVSTNRLVERWGPKVALERVYQLQEACRERFATA